MDKSMAIVLAAGRGTRMRLDKPKALIEVCGRPMIDYVIDAVRQARVDKIVVVVGFGSDMVRTALGGVSDVKFVEQRKQLGTGHAVLACRDELASHNGPVVILAGDSPLTQGESLRALLDQFEDQRPACLVGTTYTKHPTGLGRVIRDISGNFSAIVEERDATSEQRMIEEVSMSTYVFQVGDLLAALDRMTQHNVQAEYYITDCPGILKEAGKDVLAIPALQPYEALSVNTMDELAVVEGEMKRLQSP